MPMATDCSACVSTRQSTTFQCGWCDTSCTVSEECSISLITMGTQCPAPSITSISPTSGPSKGRTVITINGRNLGVTFSDFNASDSIELTVNGANVRCVPLSDGYMSGTLVLCRTMPISSVGTYSLVVNLPRSTGSSTATSNFEILLPTITDVNPLFGPIAGGTVLTITGTNLNIGNAAVVMLNESTELLCVTM